MKARVAMRNDGNNVRQMRKWKLMYKRPVKRMNENKRHCGVETHAKVANNQQAATTTPPNTASNKSSNNGNTTTFSL